MKRLNSALVSALCLTFALSGCGADDSEATVGYKLAEFDGQFDSAVVANYEKRIAQAAIRCGEPEMTVANKAVGATLLLDERGITERSLWVMNSLLRAIPPDESGAVSCSEVLGRLVTLRISE